MYSSKCPIAFDVNVEDYNIVAKWLINLDVLQETLRIYETEDALIDLQFLGIGTAEKSGNRAYFIVVRSEKLQEVRKRYGLPEQDFHVTLGFKWKDVFGVRKNEVLKEKEPFLKLLNHLY